MVAYKRYSEKTTMSIVPTFKILLTPKCTKKKHFSGKRMCVVLSSVHSPCTHVKGIHKLRKNFP